jgi:hypothetical protein
MSNSLPETEKSQPGLEPRLLNAHGAARYLGVSYWSIRDWAMSGRLRTVTLPPLQRREGDPRPPKALRRLLFDRSDLDRFVDERRGDR